ncbi:MAG TPA: alpha/beta hydrolase [Alphaproteobacteria bacterium]|jgi:pimeloyl-ACP methyl ester carboxylesterase
MGERTPLILLPGLLCDRALWQHQLDHLVDLAETTVPDLGSDESVEGMARRVLDAAPARFALAALSMGGYVAHAIMRAAPERVLRLALFDTSARPDTDEQKSRRRGLVSLAEKGKFKGVTPRLLPLLIHPGRLEDKPLTEAVMGMAERIGKQAFLRQQKAIMGRPDSRPRLPAYHCPTLIAAGRMDAITPVEVNAEMASLIPSAKLVIVEESGHLLPMEQPVATTALMRYWLQV